MAKTNISTQLAWTLSSGSIYIADPAVAPLWYTAGAWRIFPDISDPTWASQLPEGFVTDVLRDTTFAGACSASMANSPPNANANAAAILSLIAVPVPSAGYAPGTRLFIANSNIDRRVEDPSILSWAGFYQSSTLRDYANRGGYRLTFELENTVAALPATTQLSQVSFMQFYP